MLAQFTVTTAPWQQHHGAAQSTTACSTMSRALWNHTLYHSTAWSTQAGAGRGVAQLCPVHHIKYYVYRYVQYMYIFTDASRRNYVIKPHTFTCSAGQPWGPKWRDIYTHICNINMYTSQWPGPESCRLACSGARQPVLVARPPVGMQHVASNHPMDATGWPLEEKTMRTVNFKGYVCTIQSTTHLLYPYTWTYVYITCNCRVSRLVEQFKCNYH